MHLQEMAANVLTTGRTGQACSFKGQQYSGDWIGETAAKVSSALSDLEPGEPVAFAPRNRPSSIAALLALLASGRTIPMLYPFQSPNGLANDVRRLKLRALLASSDDLQGPVIEALQTVGARGLALDEDAGARMHSRPSSLSAVAATQAPEDPAIRILTSGTTGAPKHFSVTYATIGKWLAGVSMMFEGAPSLRPPELIYFPLSNISGLYHFLPILMSGQPFELLEKFDIMIWLNHMKRHRPKFGSLPPPGLRMLLDAQVPPEDLSFMRYMRTGAAAIDHSTIREFQKKYGIPLLSSYGATEYCGPVTYMTPELSDRWGDTKFGTSGKVWNGAQMRIVDAETGEVLPPGKEGLVEVIAPLVGPDWIRSTDVGILDEDGFFFHRGRADGAIMRGGFKLLPEVIEAAIVTHDAVALAAVVGIAEPRLGQVPVAAIQLRPGVAPPAEDELIEHIRQRVYKTHVPVAFRFVDTLPRTPSMKIDVRAVRALFSETPRGT